jgi:glycosyltransferase involved in cell wall biosynthesis
VSVVISHPSVAPFVQQAARAIDEAGQLSRFLTTVRDDPKSILQRSICSVGRLLGRDLSAQFRRRAVTEIALSKVEAHPWGELLRLGTGALDRDGRLTDFVWQRTENGFDRLVARRLEPTLTGVYGFEYSSRFTFERARSLGLRIAYDVPAPESQFVEKILEAEFVRFPELLTQYRRYTANLEIERTAHRREEWRCADVVIAASGFTKRSFSSAGMDVGKVHVVPYGAPPPVTGGGGLADAAPDRPLSLIWAGTFGIRKGAHYLLEAWRAAGFGRHARLKVFGAVEVPARVIKPTPEGVEFHGSVPRSELMDHYRNSDALIFPTLCDGFGMVVTEAWSQGLPVITTDCAGASDLLKPGMNGLLIRAGEEKGIREAIEWCLAHRHELRAMRECALATAANWQWADYRRSLANVLRTSGLFGTST